MSQRTFAFMNRGLTYDLRSTSTVLSKGFALAITIFIIFTLQTKIRFGTGVGLMLFTGIIYSNLFFIGMMNLKDYASVITEEKEHKMLGLLLMTGINPLGILLGKSIPKQVNSLLIILIQFPFTLLAITLGGVTLEQILAAYVILIAFLFFIANLGLLCSVLSEENKAASALLFTFYILAFLLAPTLCFLLGIYTFSFFSTIGSFLNMFNPISQLNIIMQTGFSSSPFSYEVFAFLIGGGLSIFLSWLVFENLIIINESKESSTIEKSRPFKLKSKKQKKAEKSKDHKLTRPSERSWDNALSWKHFYFTMGGKKAIKKRFLIYSLVILLVSTASYFIAAINMGASFNISHWKMVMAYFIQISSFIVFCIEPIINIHHLYAEETEKHTYQLIYMLPMTLKQTIWNKFIGGLVFMIPSALFFCLGYILYPDGVQEMYKEMTRNIGIVALLLLFISFYLIFQTTSFFSSLFSKKTSMFSSWASFKSQGLFGLLFFIYGAGIFLILLIHQNDSPSSYEFIILNFIFIVGAIKLIHFKMIQEAES